ncbi:MAG: hypothetical protein JW850_15290 [Thermoflexales bacterium]|nr:hypothetical protein [Thermoflexales bacterium]
MSERLSVIEHNGKTIYAADFSELKGQEFLQTLQQALERDAKIPDESLIFQDITDSVVDNEIKNLLRQSMDMVKRKKFKVALVGVTGFKRTIAQLLNPSSYFAKSTEDALEWLARA